MERNPLLSQTGGRPPNNTENLYHNIIEGAAALPNNTNMISNTTTSSQSSRCVPKNTIDNDKTIETIKNSQIGKDLFATDFPNQTVPPDIQESFEYNSNDPKILENTQELLETYMDQEIDSISSLEEFKTVNYKKRKFEGDVKIDLTKCQFKKCDNVNNVNRTNKYSLLGDLNVEAERPNVGNNNSKIHNDSQAQIKARNSFCPPIFLENVNVKSLIDQLSSKNVEFKIKNQSKHKSKLYFKDSSAHSEMMQLLKEREISSYTYTPKEYKRHSVICRGLYHKSDVNDIKSEIDKIAPDTVDSISKFSTEYSRKRGIDTGLFLVILKPNRRVNELLGVKYILNQVVSWERPKANTKIPQCWRCQRWGHYSRNCSRPFSCLKCSEKHGPGACTFVSENNELPYCVNCNENGHTSNYRGCPAYKKYVSLRKKANKEAKERQISAAGNVAMALNPSNAVQENKSFASMFNVLSTNSTQTKPKKPPLIQEFMELAKTLCGPEPFTLEDKIANFMKNYKSMTRDQAKKECLNLIKCIQDVYGP